MIESGLVAFYDIRPGNRACLFLQPWSPHGDNQSTAEHHATSYNMWCDIAAQLQLQCHFP